MNQIFCEESETELVEKFTKLSSLLNYPLSLSSKLSSLSLSLLNSPLFSTDDFQLNASDLTGGMVFNPQGALTIHNWASSNQNSLNTMGGNNGGGNSTNGGGQMGQLTVSTNSPQAGGNSHSPSSSSSSNSNNIKVKNEPISPPRDLSQQQHHQQQQHQHVISLSSRTSNTNNNNNHLSPGHPPLTPSSSSSPDPSGSDYDDGPMHKRLRVTTDATWPA